MVTNEKGQYKPKFTSDDFLAVMTTAAMTTAEVCRRVDCNRKTAQKYLGQLEKSNKIKKVTIIGSQNYGWIKEA